jgi:hypothetical protein
VGDAQGGWVLSRLKADTAGHTQRILHAALLKIDAFSCQFV